MNEIQHKKRSPPRNSKASDVKVEPEGQQNGTGSLAASPSSSSSGVFSGNGAQYVGGNSCLPGECLQNPEIRLLVNDFQQNVFKLLTTKVKWRLKSVRNQDGTLRQPEVLNREPTPAELQEVMQYIDEMCKRFDSSLTIGDDEAENAGARAPMPVPMELELDDGGRMEFNPFKLVATLGQKLKLASHLMDVVKDAKRQEMLAALGVGDKADVKAAVEQVQENNVAAPEDDDEDKDASMPPLHYFP